MIPKNESIVYPVVNPKEWADRYNITVRSNPCVNCGKVLTPTIPFATGTWRGLTSKPHGCDVEFDLFIAAKSTAKERQEIIDYFHGISRSLR